MKERWIAIREKIDALSLRERALVLFSVLAVVYLLWDMLLFSPVADAKAKVDRNLLDVTQKISAMEQEERVLLATLASDPDSDLKKQVLELETNLSRLDAELAAISAGLVPVDQLTTILQEVLVKTGALQLHQLQTLPVEALELTTPDIGQGGDPNNTKSAGVYKHAVHLEVRGNYLQLITYLKVLEAMRWGFYWEELRYELNEYPRGHIRLKVFTLSTDEGLFGV